MREGKREERDATYVKVADAVVVVQRAVTAVATLHQS